MEKIWLNKYVKVFTGLEDIVTSEISWICHGVFLIDAPTHQYDAITNTLSFSGVDLMSKFTGARNGNLEGIPYIIESGADIRGVMISLLELAGFKKYIIEENQNTLLTPREIRIDIGGTVFDVLRELRDIEPGHEMFFDVEGVFIYQKIPTDEQTPILIDDNIFNEVVISESVNINFEDVKNVIEVVGKSHTPDRFVTQDNVKLTKEKALTEDNIVQDGNNVYIIIDDIIVAGKKWYQFDQ